MPIFIPDLMAELIPSKSAAGFILGEDIYSIQKRIGPVAWYENDLTLTEKLLSNEGWIGVKSKQWSSENICKYIYSLIYMDDVICLDFESSLKLCRIDIGKGYEGDFHGIKPGDDLLKLEQTGFEVFFNDSDDDFLILDDGCILVGISFMTDYRASLKVAPNQKIQYISIRNWSFR